MKEENEKKNLSGTGFDRENTTKQTDLKWKYIYLKYNVIKKILENIKLDGAKISLFDSDFSPDYSSLSIVKYRCDVGRKYENDIQMWTENMHDTKCMWMT
jgi:hypothetical protein